MEKGKRRLGDQDVTSGHEPVGKERLELRVGTPGASRTTGCCGDTFFINRV